MLLASLHLFCIPNLNSAKVGLFLTTVLLFIKFLRKRRRPRIVEGFFPEKCTE